MPTLSVVINTYNYGRFIVDAVESVLAQSLPATEIIIVDDGSTDETPKVLEERYGRHPKVKVLRQRNGGQGTAFATGLENATGDLVFFLDADDKYEPNHLESVAKAFEARKDIDFVFTAHRQFGEADRVVQRAPRDLDFGFSVALALGGVFVGSATSTLSMRRDLVQTILPAIRQVAPRWRIRADDLLVYGSSVAGARKLYLAAPTVLYRVHGKNAFFAREVEGGGFSHRLRRDSYLQILAKHLGLDPAVHLDLSTEFQSIEMPDLQTYRDYRRINRRSNESPLKRLKVRVRLYQHYRKHGTRDAPG